MADYYDLNSGIWKERYKFNLENKVYHCNVCEMSFGKSEIFKNLDPNNE